MDLALDNKEKNQRFSDFNHDSRKLYSDSVPGSSEKTADRLFKTKKTKSSDEEGFMRVVFNGSDFQLEDGKYEPRRFVQKAKVFMSGLGTQGQIKHDFIMKLCKMFGLSTQEFNHEDSDSTAVVNSIMQEAEARIRCLDNQAATPLERRIPITEEPATTQVDDNEEKSSCLADATNDNIGVTTLESKEKKVVPEDNKEEATGDIAFNDEDL